MFGALICISSVRFVRNGWVERCYVKPGFFFKYWGFEWVQPLPEPWMTAAYVAMAVLAACIAVGFLYRIAVPLFLALFTYVELIDVTNYLNHYYLVSLIALLMCVIPMNAAYSADAVLWPERRSAWLPAWALYLMRFQVGVVYFFAGLAKLQPDWLLHAQPLTLWLSSRAETPWIGGLITLPFAPIIMSWAGFLHDIAIVPLLLWRRSRPWAYMLLVAFHVGTHLLFNIGIFPFLMTICATVFFEPDWPRRLALRLRRGHSRLRGLVWSSKRTPFEHASPERAPFEPATPERASFKHAVPTRAPLGHAVPARAPFEHAPSTMFRWSNFAAAMVALYCIAQIAMPLRSHAYAGDVLWHEQGMRYAWRVMVRAKSGSVTYRARWKGSERELLISPSRYLTSHQEREMSGQPDLILQLARHIAADLEAKGHEGVEVRANALVAFNGRRAAPMIDPAVDLAAQRDGVHKATWILPLADPKKRTTVVAETTPPSRAR